MIDIICPRISPLGAYLFLMLFGLGLIQGGRLLSNNLIHVALSKIPFLHNIKRTV